MTVRSLLQLARWYLRELTGEGEYERYAAWQRTHPHLPALSRQEYDRLRMDRQDSTPGARCC